MNEFESAARICEIMAFQIRAMGESAKRKDQRWYKDDFKKFQKSLKKLITFDFIKMYKKCRKEK